MRKKIAFNSFLEVYPKEDWSEEDQVLTEKAILAMDQAYAPYSNFHVGAALVLENGEMYTANNQENVSFPAGICAERSLLAYAMAQNPNSKPKKIVISAKKKDSPRFATISPCGLCRQTISEYEAKFKTPIQVMMLNSDGDLLVADRIEQLLPFQFIDLNA